jgi:FPC/CPF motif-containing protein YcgG
MLPSSIDNGHPLAGRFRQFLVRTDFPCVGAKAALAKQQIQMVIARDITSSWNDLAVYRSLFNFAQRYRPQKRLFQSFVVLFEGPRCLTEKEFEKHLWCRLQSLTDKDEWHGQRPDGAVSADPTDSHFSLSFGGESFFVIGLHPGSSRPARRFCVPAIVFNLHDQFEQLRSTGLYDKLRSSILERDKALAGSVNPMLQVHGEGSEARQYSGRVVEDDWRCPFHRSGRRGAL